ncbi:putative colanic acid biosynthesis acetyltransferase [Mycobacterium sp. MYCO198283]|uniref:putative colanic acid biosynthesis acetyltransferase n=1 Tax=Mycobacterium sp. MYCO198283 TaxID=2883505 RepID=UPI001E54DD40|nr:putative colanic acid biosynthesis acetyltransferase [Mycobacterium sp. MYCO198283]MCG5432247.1 putative colanic acid biosynthesis acetyltransferase [Mycobacterium sp. MYCO198283]
MTATPQPVEVSPGERFSLRDFSGYDKGRGFFWQLAWVIASNTLMNRLWFPRRLRVAVLRAFGATIGERLVIRHTTKIQWPWNVTIGDDCWIGEDVQLLSIEKITIGSNTCISQGAVICAGSHDPSSPTFECNNAPIVIGDGCWIALRAAVLAGSTIGDGVTVGACALVSGDVPAGTTLVAPRSIALPR